MADRDRRAFLEVLTSAAVAASVQGCSALQRRVGDPATSLQCAAPVQVGGRERFDYVIVGSGAGGGPIAANLALAGYSVLLLEAGGDPAIDQAGRENPDYAVPVFHARASEDPLLAWNYYVRHYRDDAQSARDPKFVAQHDGVLYPRAGTLGGCTAHNAMITVYPNESDWDGIARLTGDESWSANHMRRYFERMERCRYASVFDLGNRAGHGFDGWLTTEKPDPGLLLRDGELTAAIERAVRESIRQSAGSAADLFEYRLDPNDVRAVRRGAEGAFVTPLATLRGRRRGTRDRLREVEAKCGGRLTIRTHALATRILFDPSRRASGVRYLEGANLYRAAPAVSSASGVEREVEAAREVILAAGAFNSPQLLKLSGIGPRDELERLGIPVLIDLPGVGRNLQDRYEVGIVSRMQRDFELTRPCTFVPDGNDPCMRDWRAGRGVYTTNGAVVGIVKRSAPDKGLPDLFVFGFPGSFRGYYPGYSNDIAQYRDRFTWAILQAHTRNTAGSVTLRSADPRDVPDIDFRYFEEGNDASGEDLRVMERGVAFARDLGRHMGGLVLEEDYPGSAVEPGEAVRTFVRNEAWGHHASCTNPIGPSSDPLAVVDSRFRVHGTSALRIVDASVFPRIPGMFIVTAVYMISEKASDVVLADARR